MIAPPRRRVLAAFAAALLVHLIAPVAASAAEPVGVRLREATIQEAGAVRLVVSVSGSTRTLTADDLAVRQDGAAVQAVSVAPLTDNASVPVAVALTMDVSGSTAGKPLADAKQAAHTFVGGLPSGVRVGLVSFGEKAQVVVPFTTDHAVLAKAIDALQAGGGTALYDGVTLASRTLARSQAQANVVVFSDGRDTSSSATLTEAVATARDAKATVMTIGLGTADLDTSALNALASRTGGRSVRVGGSADLTSAFRTAARDIASQYILTYSSLPTERGDVTIEVAASIDGARATDAIVALSPRVTVSPPPAHAVPLPEPAAPLVPAFAGETGLYVGLGAAFAALFAFLMVLLRRPKRSESEAVLVRGLRLYSKAPGRKAKREGSLPGGLARRATELLDKVPRPAKYEERLQALIDRAGWPFRAPEFVAIQIGTAFAGAIIGGGLLGRWLFALVFAALGPFVMVALLKRTIARRQAAVLEQLPDTLQLLAGSLQAGYGFLQAIDTLCKETAPPTSTEFNRVLTEARLGMPVEDALNAMADRLGSEDFRWVVLAINIQRQVGGNLATLLRTVADTLRERERVRRQITVLSAEGKLSAYILGGLPFGIAGYITMVNPGFIQTMTTDPLGRLMIGGALVMLGIGIVWMRKIIRIEV